MPRRRSMQPPINSVKHYVPHANSSVLGGAVESVKVVNAVVAPAVANAESVKEGSVIKNVYLEYWIGGDGSSGDESQFTFTVEKKRDQEADPTFAQMSNLGSYPNKKNILYTTQGIVPAMLDGGMTIPLVRGWQSVPKGKQRFGNSDEIIVTLAAVSPLRFCGFATYKEYT